MNLVFSVQPTSAGGWDVLVPDGTVLVLFLALIILGSGISTTVYLQRK